jgi:hypothetical protein
MHPSIRSEQPTTGLSPHTQTIHGGKNKTDTSSRDNKRVWQTAPISTRGPLICIGNIISMKVTVLVHHGWSITYSKRLKTQQTYCDLPRPRGRGEREREYERERDRPARKER